MEHPLRLGELLVKTGVLSEGVLNEVLVAQKTEKRRLGDLLAEKNLVPPRRLAQILSYQLSCPWVSLTNIEIPKPLIELVPRELALKHTAVPVHQRTTPTGNALYLALYDPTDEVALGDCARVVKMAVRPMVAITYEIRQALSRYYGAPAPSLTTAPSPVPAPVVEKLAKPPPVPPKKEPPRTEESSKMPVVLVLNAPERFREQCLIAAFSIEARVEDGSLMTAAEQVKAERPVAIVVTDDVYAFDRARLNRLAIENDAALVVWGEDVEAHQLEPLLQGALRRRC